MDKSREGALFQRLRLRLTIAYAAITGVILIGMAGSVLAVSQRQLNAKGEAAFQSEVNAILYHLRSQTVIDHTWLSQTEAGGNLQIYLELSGEPLRYEENLERQLLIDGASEFALQKKEFDIAIAPSSRYQPEQTSFLYQAQGGQRWRTSALRLPQDKGWIGFLVLRSMEGEEQELMVQRVAFAGFVLTALVFLSFFSWRFTKFAMRPMEESRRRQVEFIAAASHELRSPLAVVRTCLSALDDTNAERSKHFTDMAKEECCRLSCLINDMLALANADSGTWSMHRGPVEPETLVLNVAERYEHTARKKGIHLSTMLPEEPLPTCQWDGERICQLLVILVDNAVSYTPNGGRVELSVTRWGEQISLVVTDSGPGIPDHEKRRIFERFYRTDRSRTEQTHCGLGLCIAQEIAQLHHGSLLVVDAPGGGASFLARLPIAD